MSEFDKNYPSTEALSRLRNNAIFNLLGFALLFICRIAAGKLVLAIGIGVFICAIAVGWLMANNPDNKKTGAIILSVGILVILSGVKISIFPVITGIALSIISVGLLAMGLKSLFLYFHAKRRG
jgi:hypothetical protein